jgi:hypothetical protein
MSAAFVWFPWLILGAGAAVASPQESNSRPILMQPVCDRVGGALPAGQREFFWPRTDPVWSFCAIRPANSTGESGSGIELYNVHYKGRLVLKRANAPILNVLYQSGCGCFRDWSDQEQAFQSGNVVATGWSEPSTPPVTVCEHPGADIGSFAGVAIENRGDSELVLTAQMQAGWYRYIMRWFFYPDGRMKGWFGFAAVPAGCIQYAHTHHNYWRLDFDIDGAANDRIDVVPVAGGPSSPVATEAKSMRGPAYWVVSDQSTGRGFVLTPGDSVAADGFAVSDLWFLRYKATEMDDSSQSHSCAIRIDPFLNGESLTGQDVVVWLRGGQFHEAGDLDDCHTVDFTLTPKGVW